MNYLSMLLGLQRATFLLTMTCLLTVRCLQMMISSLRKVTRLQVVNYPAKVPDLQTAPCLLMARVPPCLAAVPSLAVVSYCHYCLPVV